MKALPICGRRRRFFKETRKLEGENFLSEMVFVNDFAGVTNAVFVSSRQDYPSSFSHNFKCHFVRSIAISSQ